LSKHCSSCRNPAICGRTDSQSDAETEFQTIKEDALMMTRQIEEGNVKREG
jgi:hypothetical protein